MLNSRVPSYRDLEAFLARGEETDSPFLSRSPLSAEEITERRQAAWQNRLPYTGHCAHHQDNGDGDPPNTLAMTLITLSKSRTTLMTTQSNARCSNATNGSAEHLTGGTTGGVDTAMFLSVRYRPSPSFQGYPSPSRTRTIVCIALACPQSSSCRLTTPVSAWSD